MSLEFYKMASLFLEFNINASELTQVYMCILAGSFNLIIRCATFMNYFICVPCHLLLIIL